MLQSKYKFTASYEDLAIVCAHLKAIQARAVIVPHTSKEGKSLEILLCLILKNLAMRIDAKLFDYASKVSFNMNLNEALAFHCAYKYNWLPQQTASQEIFETIDRRI